MSDSTFKGFRYPASLDARSSQFGSEHDYEAYVRQLMRQLLLTAPGERVMRPDFGCGVRQMLFMPLGEATASMTRVMVREAIETYLSEHVIVDSVSVTAAEARLDITVSYVLRRRGTSQTLDVEVSA